MNHSQSNTIIFHQKQNQFNFLVKLPNKIGSVDIKTKVYKRFKNSSFGEKNPFSYFYNASLAQLARAVDS